MIFYFWNSSGVRMTQRALLSKSEVHWSWEGMDMGELLPTRGSEGRRGVASSLV